MKTLCLSLLLFVTGAHAANAATIENPSDSSVACYRGDLGYVESTIAEFWEIKGGAAIYLTYGGLKTVLRQNKTTFAENFQTAKTALQFSQPVFVTFKKVNEKIEIVRITTQIESFEYSYCDDDLERIKGSLD